MPLYRVAVTNLVTRIYYREADTAFEARASVARAAHDPDDETFETETEGTPRILQPERIPGRPLSVHADPEMTSIIEARP